MSRKALNWQLITGMTLALCLSLGAVGSAQFTPFTDGRRAILEGNWQSCREADGDYSERIYDGNAPGFGRFELHMGPYRDFALFRGVQEAHRDHDAAENLLRPHVVEVSGAFGKHVWNVGPLEIEATLAGGSREECESWFVVLKRIDTSSN